MVVVSDFMRYYKLSKDKLNDQHFWLRLVSDLQHSLSKQQSIEDKIMVVKLQDIVCDDSTIIPKLTQKKI